VPVGAPLHIILTRTIPVKHVGIPVEGKVVENVYVFDHLVIPAGMGETLMEVTIELPEDIGQQLTSEWRDLPRAALEALSKCDAQRMHK